MGLSKKTFLYSIALALMMVTFVIGYFAVMLSSLYVDYVERSNLASVVEVQRGYMENRTYDGLNMKNPTSVYSVEIPDEGDVLYATGKFFKLTLTVQDEALREVLGQVRELMNGVALSERSTWSEDFGGDMQGEAEALWEELGEKLGGESWIPEAYPVDIQLETRENSGVYEQEYFKLHMPSEDMLVCEAGVSDGDYGYTTYMAFGRTQDAVVLTVMAAMTPRMEELTPIVMESLPMIAAVVFLLVLLSSRFFSGKIVNPIIRLAGYAQTVELTDGFEADAFSTDTEDEIGDLGRSLQELYQKLHDSYAELERKNRLLEEENERKEVFLRASSHQLKTPITAALLLVDGMINEVGKYKSTKTYLPEVKKQLLSMRKMVEDILYLNRRANLQQREPVALEILAKELVRGYAVQTEARSLAVSVSGRGTLLSDREMLWTVADNLLSNAVQYTPDGGRITITVRDGGLCIRNYGVTISEALFPNIYEPFVSSDGGAKGKGLGLYVAAYYSRLLDCRLSVRNMEDSVCAELTDNKTCVTENTDAEVQSERNKMGGKTDVIDDQTATGKIRQPDGAAD
ncbi:MAG: HAMP domain-containing histidine kinase [Roseburia sp.]|nr:HAMP domain-containing histidine kinase [Roseburia sp.]